MLHRDLSSVRTEASVRSVLKAAESDAVSGVDIFGIVNVLR